MTLLAASLSYAATYEVPVSPELAPYATFEVDGLSVERRDGQLSVRFNLPEDLVGPDVAPIVLQGSELPDASGKLLLAGELARAECLPESSGAEPEGLVCRVAYYFEPHYGFKARLRLFFKYFGKPGYTKRVKVAKAFDGDPVGILRLPFGAASR